MNEQAWSAPAPESGDTPEARGRGRTSWVVIGSVVALAVIVFWLVTVVTQRSRHGDHAASVAVSSSTPRPSPAQVSFPAGLSSDCVGEDGKKTAMTIERVRQSGTTVSGSCRFVQQVRDEVDRRGPVTQSYETNLYSDFLAARGKTAWVPLTCGPQQGFTVCRGGTPALEIWVSPKV